MLSFQEDLCVLTTQHFQALVSIMKSRLDRLQLDDVGNAVIKEFFQEHSFFYKSVHGIIL